MKNRNFKIWGSILSLLLISGVIYWSGSNIKAENSDTNLSEPVLEKTTTTAKGSTRDHMSEEFLANPENDGWKRIEVIEHSSIPIDNGQTFNFGIGGYDPADFAGVPNTTGIGKNINANQSRSTFMTPNIYLKSGSIYVGAIGRSDKVPMATFMDWTYQTGNNTLKDITSSMKIDKLYTGSKVPPVNTDGRYYKKVMRNGMTAYMYRYYTITKNVSMSTYDNPFQVTQDIQLANTMIMTGQRNGSVKVDYYVQNLPYLRTANPSYVYTKENSPDRIDAFIPSDEPNTKVLNDFTLNGTLDPKLGENNKSPVKLIGDQTGVYVDGQTFLGNARINYYMNLPDGPENWTAGNDYGAYYGASTNPNAFKNRFATGYEAVPGNIGEAGGAGTALYSKGFLDVGLISGGQVSIYPRLFFKNQPKDQFKPGDIVGYSFQYGLSLVSDAPNIFLDEDEYNITDQNQTAKISGIWYDGSSLSTTLCYSVDGGPEQEYTPEPYASKAQLGNEMPFEVTIPNLTKEEHTITMYAINSEDEPKRSETRTAKIVYVAGEPKLTLDKKNGGVGQDFTISGNVINRIAAEPDRELHYNPTDIYIKKIDEPDSSYKLATTIDANSVDSKFSYTIPASEIPAVANADYRFSIRAINKYDMISNVENIRLALNHAKPTFELASSNIQLLDNTKLSYSLELANLKQAGDSYPLFIQYKVDDETNWTKLDNPIGATDPSKPTIDTAKATFEISAEKLPFETAHTVTVTVVDNFDVEADAQKVDFIRPGKPALVLENKNGPSLGETQTVKGTITTEYFPAKFQYKIVKNGEAGAAYQELAEKDVVIDQTSGKFSFTLAKELFPVGASYEIFVKGMDKYNQETEEVSYRLTEVVHFKVKFVNAIGATIHPDITIDRELGTTIDLALEKVVQDTLTKLKKQYTMDKSSVPAVPVKVDSSTAFWEYKFTGKLFIASFPSRLNFGNKALTTKFIKVEQPKYDVPLVIGDTRNSKTPWTLTATLEKPLTSEESPSEVLKRALWYKKSDSSKEMLYENEALPIEVGTVSGTGEYNVSSNWDNKTSGLEVNVYASEIIEKGDYKATILWQVGATP